MNYENHNSQKALKQWNTFMVESGIRKYCQESCKGMCCSDYLSNNCSHKCNNSVACVVQLCPDLTAHKDHINHKYNEYRSHIISIFDALDINGYATDDKIFGVILPSTVMIWDPTNLIQEMYRNLPECVKSHEN